MSTMHMLAPALVHICTSWSYMSQLPSSSTPGLPDWARYCQRTGRRKALSPLLTKWAIWVRPPPVVTMVSSMPPLQLPQTSQPKSKPAMLTPPKLTVAAAVAARKRDLRSIILRSVRFVENRPSSVGKNKE